ncbi:MAG: DNA sulfur modification protein DndB [Planctomycetia bacterium]|nr:DNA sulfur modification protein DndB [Planctomycetia bacterium]
MNTDRFFGNVRVVTCTDAVEASTKAGQEVANTAGFPVPVVIFWQGSRLNMAGALPFAFVAMRLSAKSANKKASISETVDKMNRPEIAEHAETIKKYIIDNRSKQYILPPLTLNLQEEAKLFTGDSASTVKTGVLVLHATTKLAITDGQHRRSAIQHALDDLSGEEAQQLAKDGIGVVITSEMDSAQIHQDFADCSKTKALPPSQLAVYDRRNPANRMVVEAEERCPLFRGKIDATSVTLGKNSTSLFLANQVRQFVKTWLTGNWQMGDDEFEKQANVICRTDETYETEFNKFLDFVNYLTEVIPIWNEIAALQPGVESNRIKEWRQHPGYVCMSVTGLVVLGRIGYELFSRRELNWRQYADKLGTIDWSKSGPLWVGNLVREDKIVNSQRLVRDATDRVRQVMGWGKQPAEQSHSPQPDDAALVPA